MIWKVLECLGIVFVLSVSFVVLIEASLGYIVDKLYNPMDEEEQDNNL